MVDMDLVLAADTIIGESPTWSPAEAALYWIDIKRPALQRLDPATGCRQTWPMPADIGAFALTSDLLSAVVALRTGLFQLQFASGAIVLLAPPPFDPALHRFNEGACDAAGRFWIGVMFDPVEGGKQVPSKASLQSFTFAGGLQSEPDAAELHNGMVWSAGDQLFYVAHSEQREINTFRYGPDGRISDRTHFATIPKDLGIPDGAAIDAAGGYWCAIHGGGRLRRFHADGSFDRDVAIPASQPTMCAFGGADLDMLYITSASAELSPADRQREPYAGALFSFRPGERGIPRHFIVR